MEMMEAYTIKEERPESPIGAIFQEIISYSGTPSTGAQLPKVEPHLLTTRLPLSALDSYIDIDENVKIKDESKYLDQDQEGIRPCFVLLERLDPRDLVEKPVKRSSRNTPRQKWRKTGCQGTLRKKELGYLRKRKASVQAPTGRKRRCVGEERETLDVPEDADNAARTQEETRQKPRREASRGRREGGRLDDVIEDEGVKRETEAEKDGGGTQEEAQQKPRREASRGRREEGRHDDVIEDEPGVKRETETEKDGGGTQEETRQKPRSEIIRGRREEGRHDVIEDERGVKRETETEKDGGGTQDSDLKEEAGTSANEDQNKVCPGSMRKLTQEVKSQKSRSETSRGLREEGRHHDVIEYVPSIKREPEAENDGGGTRDYDLMEEARTSANEEQNIVCPGSMRKLTQEVEGEKLRIDSSRRLREGETNDGRLASSYKGKIERNIKSEAESDIDIDLDLMDDKSLLANEDRNKVCPESMRKLTQGRGEKPRKKPYDCTFCTKTYLRKRSLEIHLQTHGDRPIRRYECDICKATRTHKYGLVNHMRIHTKEKPYKCRICGKGFSQSGSLREHLALHSESKPHKCPVCSMTFKRKSTLKSHCTIHTGNRPHKCLHCNKAFTVPNNLRIHLRIHTGERPYKCSQCPQAFAQAPNLKIHLRRHTGEKPFKCSSCSKAFNGANDLKRHFRCHTGEKPYKCSQCPKAFTQAPNLNKHLRRHTGEKPYKCSSCSKAFNGANDLKKHFRCHTGERPYKCSQCPQAFAQAPNLKTHLRRHTGEKPFKCSLCPKPSPQQMN